jgi:hypothetical protein
MRYLFFIISLFVAFVSHQTNTEGELFANILPGGVITASIDSPVAGEVVQGAVVVRGSTAVERFQYYEIDFASTAQPAQNWLLIQESSIPIQDGILAVWDTNSITDGDYNLRLVIFKTDGSQSVVTVMGLRVRNYSPIDNPTPSPTVMYVTLGPGTPTSTPTPQDTQTPSATPLPSTPTTLPVNPAEITPPQLLSTFGIGAALSLGLFVLLGAYMGIRKFSNGRKLRRGK